MQGVPFTQLDTVVHILPCPPPGPPPGPPICETTIININLDQYPEETSWDIKDSLGNTTNLCLPAAKLLLDLLCFPVTIEGGGTKKVCLPAAKVRSMSKAERAKVVRAKRTAANGGKYKRSSKSFVKGARKKGQDRDWETNFFCTATFDFF